APSWRAAVSRAAAASASLTPEDRLAVTDRAPARRPAGWAPAPPAVAPKGAAAAVWAAASSVTPAAGRPSAASPSAPGCWTRTSRLNRSEEHTSELQSRENLVCRLLLEKKKKQNSQSDVLCLYTA